MSHSKISKLTGKFQLLTSFTSKGCASEHKLKLTLFHDNLLMIPATLNKKKMQL